MTNAELEKRITVLEKDVALLKKKFAEKKKPIIFYRKKEIKHLPKLWLLMKYTDLGVNIASRKS